MKSAANINLYICHAILNSLFAGHQGRYARFNMLSKFYPTNEIDWELSIISNNLDALSIWMKEMWGGHPLDFSGPEESLPMPSKNALNDLVLLKKELLKCLDQSQEIVANCEDGKITFENAVTLASLLIQRAYSREHYIKGLITYAKHGNNQEEAKVWEAHMQSCFQEMTSAHEFFEELLISDEPSDKLSDDILDEVKFLPALLTCQVHDINQILVMRNDKFKHSDIELPGCDPKIWEKSQIPPEHAGYWHAYGITPKSVFSWIDHGFYEPSQAGCWHSYGFSPESAVKWSMFGFTPKDAATCVDAGLVNPELAEIWNETEGLVH
jgi:hypothetical protein